MMREDLRVYSDGTYVAEGFLDNDGVTDDRSASGSRSRWTTVP
jgi:hypothetical protein